MEDKNKHNRLCDKSKEELVAIILRRMMFTIGFIVPINF